MALPWPDRAALYLAVYLGQFNRDFMEIITGVPTGQANFHAIASCYCVVITENVTCKSKCINFRLIPGTPCVCAALRSSILHVNHAAQSGRSGKLGDVGTVFDALCCVVHAQSTRAQNGTFARGSGD